MKKAQIVINIVLLIGLIGLVGYQLLKKDKIAYVDVGILMGEYQGIKEASAQLEKKKTKRLANVDSLIVQFQEELKLYENERTAMTLKEKKLKEELLYNKQKQVSQYQEVIKQQNIDDESKMMQLHINTINLYIQKYGDQNGYKYILGANNQGNILFAKKKNDLTNVILEDLNKQFAIENKE